MDFFCDHFDGPVELISHWHASARGKASGKQLLSGFVLGSEVSSGKFNLAKLLVECRRLANRCGVSVVMLDETQHINTGLGVSKITDILLTLAAIGPPVIFVSNYSLVHKLLGRNSEDKQRVLSEPRIMLPDLPQSQDWKDYVAECVRVSGGQIQVDIDELSAELYRFTFGIKRLAVQLLKLAYIECRSDGRVVVKLLDISRAYRSSAYSSNSSDVEELQLQAIHSRKTGSRLDLRCPFDLPASTYTNVVKFALADREDRVNAAIFDSSRTEQERAMGRLTGLIPQDISRPTKTVRRPPIKKVSAEEMESNFHALVDSIKQKAKPKNPK
ncbi:hypothetical protein AN403_6235 [Pseudomonas fluorescens]|uniref:Transposon Tn7 transposition protein TnsC n=2 Tax=Pseudomonas fluorescens TaxID=294 RepID=A0A0P8XNM0_PSEFL|nr:hypothetical protein AN403_6235 [Pseudomonas fluorescens]